MNRFINITKLFPPTRGRTVLQELLIIVRTLSERSIEIIICGGWVPFLKDLASRSTSEHSMSLDIDLVLPEHSRRPPAVDKVRELLLEDLSFEVSREASCKLEKRVSGELVQLDLLADAGRGADGNAVIKVYGEATSLDLALLDGGVNLTQHLEEITILHQEDSGKPLTTKITIPDAVGFLMLKTEVTRFRKNEKDPYDMYYYCTRCEEPAAIRQKLRDRLSAPGVENVVRRLQYLFRYPDSLWILGILDHQKVQGLERERQAARIVRMFDGITNGLL